MNPDIWNKCLVQLESEIPADKYNIWIRPLQAKMLDDHSMILLAPNKFVIDFVRKNFFDTIKHFVDKLSNSLVSVELNVGTINKTSNEVQETNASFRSYNETSQGEVHLQTAASRNTTPLNTAINSGFRKANLNSTTVAVDQEDKFSRYRSTLSKDMTFETFVEGKCNMLARAAALQIVESIGEVSPGNNYNPFLIYGGVGLGKTHLIHALGNTIIRKKPDAIVVYLHSERFVQEMITALQNKTIDQFKNFYRSVDALLIDDIQFFAGKERTQEEFFHTFNTLLEGQKQIIMTCDSYPKEVSGLEDRLKSRFGWGLTVAIELPDVETRVAILISKASQVHVELPQDVAFFIAQRVNSNIRELEGALRRVIATARFQGHKISVDFAKIALHDLITLQEKQVSIENIQKIVAEYYKIRVADLHSKRRTRSVARPRQIAMALAKELTHHSLPEIGDAFGGRDHTTVLYACRKVDELRNEQVYIEEDYTNLHRQLTS